MSHLCEDLFGIMADKAVARAKQLELEREHAAKHPDKRMYCKWKLYLPMLDEWTSTKDIASFMKTEFTVVWHTLDRMWRKGLIVKKVVPKMAIEVRMQVGQRRGFQGRWRKCMWKKTAKGELFQGGNE